MKQDLTQLNSSESSMIRLWHRIPVFFRIIFLMIIVFEIGVVIWVIITLLIPVPCGIILMGGILCIYCLYFSGNWGSKSTAEYRKKNFRKIHLTPTNWIKGLLAAGFFVIVAQAGFVITFRLIEFPDELFTIYNFSTFPLWIAFLYILMASLVAGVCEEIGFRGYGQVPLEEKYGPIMSNIIVSIFFMIFHLHQIWAPYLIIQGFILSWFLGYLAYKTDSLIPGIIGHFVMDIINFSYWWSDVAGEFNYKPISISRVDLHFVIWLLILIFSIICFLILTSSLKPEKNQEV